MSREWTPARWRWRSCLRHPARILPVMGTNSLGRIAGLSDALKVSLDREDWFEIYSATLGTEVP
jgi:predicted oxidoreductase